MSGEIHSTLEEGVVYLTLDQTARKNALSRSMLRALGEAFPDAAKAGARAAVLSGAGGVFSAGADLSDISGTSDDAAYDRELGSASAAIGAFPGPVIALITGPCMGAAVELAMSCDIRICDTQAFFEVPAVRLGLFYNPRAIARLRRRLSAQTLARLFLLGERMSATAARDAGLVAQVFAPDELAAGADHMVRRASEGSPRAAAVTKELLIALDRGDVDMAAMEALQLEMLDSPDRRAATARAKARLGINSDTPEPDDRPVKLKGVK